MGLAGYGFLSENAEFAKNVEKAGLIVCSPIFLTLCSVLTRIFSSSAPLPKLSTPLVTKSLRELLLSRLVFQSSRVLKVP